MLQQYQQVNYRLRSRRYLYCITLLGIYALLCGIFNSNSCFAVSSAALTLGTSQKLSTTVTQGNVAYLSSTITVTGTDIESYTLSITGPVGLSGGSTITGAGDKTPSAMPNNSWGFSYNNSNANNTKTYKSFTGSVQTLETGTPNGNLTGTAKNITFAAKFASDATPAHYSGSITINLVATPKVTTVKWSNGVDSGINYMQEIITGTSATSFCKSTLPNHASIILKDKRDEKNYTIVKMADGKCWMTDNLNYRLSTSKALTSADSDVSSWTPAQNTIIGSSDLTSSDFSSSDYYKVQSYATAADAATTYYSFTAATAGSGNSSLATDGTNASLSICPKGWKLPTGGDTGEYQAFATAEGIESDSVGSAKIRGAPYNFYFNGRIDGGAMLSEASNGNWWSSTVRNDRNAYNLFSNSTSVKPGIVNYSRYRGYAIRCISK